MCKGNFDGAILTWGIIGFTFRHGEIQKLIEGMDALDAKEGLENTVDVCFDQDTFDRPLSAEFREALAFAPNSQDAKDWAAEISVATKPSKLLPDWRAAFERLGNDERMRGLQLARAYDKYWTKALTTARDLGLDDLQGKALCFDICVQKGTVSSDEREVIDRRLAELGGTPDPETRRLIVADAVAEGSKQKWIEDVRSRKRCLALGEGRVHGARYRLDQWGIPKSEQPQPGLAVGSAVASGSPEKRFNDFFSSLALKHFQAKEFAFLGAAHGDPQSPAFDLNALPEEDLWPRMVPTARVLDRLREDLKAPVRLTSVYRTTNYNSAVDGEPGSQHTLFTAVDFYCSDGRAPDHWASLLLGYRDEGFFKGGIGIYPARHFVHLDTRGENRNFNG